MASGVSTRFEFRVRPDAKQRIEHAANLAGESTSDFVRAAAELRAEEVLREHEVITRVPAAFFDELIAALDAPAQPNAALKRAAGRARRVVRR
jgi:uncharacterized protein (DUF1778 family)